MNQPANRYPYRAKSQPATSRQSPGIRSVQPRPPLSALRHVLYGIAMLLIMLVLIMLTWAVSRWSQALASQPADNLSGSQAGFISSADKDGVPGSSLPRDGQSGGDPTETGSQTAGHDQ